MSYSDFTFRDIKEKFQISIEEDANLFPHVEEIQLSQLLSEILKENVPLAIAVHTEKARSEMIIAPMLIELRKMTDRRISLFSGVEFNIDKEKGLNGICDYIISLSKEQMYITSPVFALVEAKNDNIKSGLPQCISEMIAAKIFNEREGNQIPVIYGAVTTGTVWRFLKLEENVSIDGEEYHIRQPEKIMGILFDIIGEK